MRAGTRAAVTRWMSAAASGSAASRRSGSRVRPTNATSRSPNLGADMVGDETDDPLAVRRRQQLTGVGKPFGETVDPEPPIGVEHHLDDRGVFQKPGDRRSEGRAQHARAAKDSLRFLES